MDCKKVKFATEEQAELFIAKLKRTSNRAKIPQRSYLCQICLSWHLTSIPSKESFIIKDLKKEIEDMKITISELRKENEVLKNSTRKEDRVAVKSDARVKELTTRNTRLKKENNNLRASNGELISKNLQLQKKLDEKK